MKLGVGPAQGVNARRNTLVASAAAPASNIAPANTRSAIDPALPAPPVAPDSPPVEFLEAARTALNAGRTGETQQALERAEAR